MRRLRESIKQIKSNSEGFTLLEALISVTVFAVGIMGMAALQVNSVNNNVLAEEVQQNTNTAMAQIEALMATDDDDQRIVGNAKTCFKSADGKYDICVERLQDVAIPGTKKVIVTSEFEQNTMQKTVTMKIIKPTIK